MSTTYVALLRGINVGGRNRILMADLRACFEDAGNEDVRTYIQSGNVVFRSGIADRAELTETIEQTLAQAFGYAAAIELRDVDEIRTAVDQSPAGFGGEPDLFRYDVMFLMPPTSPAAVLSALTLKDGVDTTWAGPGVVYFSRLTERASSSGLPRIVSHPVYKRMTVRNWRTTTKLLAMIGES